MKATWTIESMTTQRWGARQVPVV